MKTFLIAATLSSVALLSTNGWAASPSGYSAAPAIVVHLQSGRTFSGVVDPETNEHEFVLRTELGQGIILRPIQWDRLVQAEIVGQTISGVTLHRLVKEIRSHRPPMPFPPRAAAL
jgi:hypothetical protein